MSGRPIASHWSTATQRLNVMMPTSGSGISKERSNALPGSAVASIWRSFIQSATVLPVMPRYSALSFFTPGQHRRRPRASHWMSNISSSAVAHDDLRGPRLDALQQELVAPEEPRDELLPW